MSTPWFVVLRTLRADIHLSQLSIGRRFGVAGRTIARWERTQTLPPAYVPLALALLREHDAKRAQALALELDIGGARDVEHARTLALDHAVLAVADAHDVPPRKARRVLAMFLTHLIASGMPSEEARERLERAANVVATATE